MTAKLLKALVHDTISPIELWHRRLAHLHYRALPTLRKVSTGLPEFGDQHNGVCRGCALGKNDKRPFQSNDNKANGVLDLIHRIPFSSSCKESNVSYGDHYLKSQ